MYKYNNPRPKKGTNERMERKNRDETATTAESENGTWSKKKGQDKSWARTACYMRRAAQMGAWSVLRRRSDKTAKPVFLTDPARQAVASASGPPAARPGIS